MDAREGIEKFAAIISHQPLLGLVEHCPEHWCKPSHCFENVLEKIRRDGGYIRFGWTFHYRIAQDIGGYLFVTHHAVWHAPDGRLIDVTPFHQDSQHHPITESEGVLFLVDEAAQPVRTSHLIAPLPIRFFALEDDEKLLNYVDKLKRKEQQKCQDIYEGKVVPPQN